MRVVSSMLIAIVLVAGCGKARPATTQAEPTTENAETQSPSNALTTSESSASVPLVVRPGAWSPRFVRTCAVPYGDVLVDDTKVRVCGGIFDSTSGRYIGKQPDEEDEHSGSSGCLSGDEPVQLGDALACLGHEHQADGPETTQVRTPTGELRFSVEGRFRQVHLDSQGRVVFIGNEEVRWTSQAGDEIFHARAGGTLKLLAELPDDRLLIQVGEVSDVWSLVGTELELTRLERPIDRVVQADGTRFIISAGRQLELWKWNGDTIEVELLTSLPGGAREVQRVAARFVGTNILVRIGESVLWLEPGANEAPAPPELSALSALHGCTSLRVSQAADGGEVFSRDDWLVNRNAEDVAAFVCESDLLRTSRSDAAELSAFSDEGWAKAGADLYASEGSERWAKWWRDGEGRRTLVAHYYVGGCERTHHLVTLVENGESLERYHRYGSEMPSFLDVPRSAHAVSIDEGVHVGDPSTGRLVPR